MNLITSILISLFSIGVIFYLTYVLLWPTKKNWPEIETRVCPRCGASDYKMVAASNEGINLIIGIGNPLYVCNACGYKGVFPVINKEKSKENKERKV